MSKAQHIEFLDVLEKYKDAFSLRDEIGLAPNIEVNLQLKDTTPFYITFTLHYITFLCERGNETKN